MGGGSSESFFPTALKVSLHAIGGGDGGGKLSLHAEGGGGGGKPPKVSIISIFAIKSLKRLSLYGVAGTI